MANVDYSMNGVQIIKHSLVLLTVQSKLILAVLHNKHFPGYSIVVNMVFKN